MLRLLSGGWFQALDVDVAVCAKFRQPSTVMCPVSVCGVQLLFILGGCIPCAPGATAHELGLRHCN